MDRQDYSSASVLVHEADQQARMRLQAGLSTLGFRRIDVADRPAAVWPAIERSDYQLLILSLEKAHERVTGLATRLRREDWPQDPFAPILLTTSNGQADLIRAAARSGPDHILLHPFSGADLVRRVSLLLGARKRFVETRDYVGPCRRGQGRSDNGGQTVAVPNALKAVVEQKPELAPSPRSVRRAREGLRRIKLRNVARRIAADAANLREPVGAGAAARVDPLRVKDLAASLDVLAPLVIDAELHHLLMLWRALQQAMQRLLQAKGAAVDNALALVQQTAKALQGAVEMNAESAESLLSRVPELPALAREPLRG